MPPLPRYPYKSPIKKLAKINFQSQKNIKINSHIDRIEKLKSIFGIKKPIINKNQPTDKSPKLPQINSIQPKDKLCLNNKNQQVKLPIRNNCQRKIEKIGGQLNILNSRDDDVDHLLRWAQNLPDTVDN